MRVFNGGCSLRSEWLQVFSALQNFPKYSNWSYQCCDLHGLDSSSNFQLPQAFSGIVPNAPSSFSIPVTFWFLLFFISQARSKYLSTVDIHWSMRESKSHSHQLSRTLLSIQANFSRMGSGLLNSSSSFQSPTSSFTYFSRLFQGLQLLLLLLLVVVVVLLLFSLQVFHTIINWCSFIGV